MFQLYDNIAYQKSVLDINKKISREYIEKTMIDIANLENRILIYDNLCIEECSFETRKNAFQKTLKVQHFIDDHISNYIMSFDDIHMCLKNHQNCIQYLERCIQSKSEKIREIHDDYNESVIYYLRKVDFYVSKYGSENLPDKYLHVDQTL